MSHYYIVQREVYPDSWCDCSPSYGTEEAGLKRLKDIHTKYSDEPHRLIKRITTEEVIAVEKGGEE